MKKRSSRNRALAWLPIVALCLSAGNAMAQEEKAPKTPAEERLALLAAQKAEKDAETALILAERNRQAARLGGVPSSGIAGNVTIGSKGGELEMQLLATAAINAAMASIAEQLKPHTENATVHLYPAAHPPNLQAVAAFTVQKEQIQRALRQVTTEAQALLGQPGVESLATVGIALESITKLLGFFRSDFTVAGADLGFDDVLLLQAAARVVPAARLLVPSLYHAGAVTGARDMMGSELSTLSERQAEAQQMLSQLDAAIEAADKAAADTAGSATQKADAARRLPRLRVAAERIRAALAAHDTLLTRLLGSDEAAGALLRDMVVWRSLREPGSQLLLLKVQYTKGSSYTEKNLWTSFGAMPFSVAGGAVVSYTLVVAGNGSVLASGVIPVHGGFTSVKDVPGKVNDSALPAAAMRSAPTKTTSPAATTQPTGPSATAKP